MQRVTKQRVTIMNFLSEQKEFLSAQNIHDLLKSSGETIGLATVYRTLQSLSEAEQIDAIRSNDGEILYRKCDLEEHHHHLVCKSCGTIVEISGEVFENWITEVAAEYNFSRIEHIAELFGICSKCSSK